MKPYGWITCIIISIILLLMVCCCLLIVVLGGSWWLTNEKSRAVTPMPFVTGYAVPDNAENLQVLEQAIIPTADLRDLARRLEGKEDIPLVLDPPLSFPQLGDEKDYWVTNMDTDNSFRVKATLREVGKHTYFWIENGVSYKKNELKKLVMAFDNNIFSTNREFFGEEFSPGIDGDKKLYMLLAKGLGSSIAAYFSSVDSYSVMAHEYSNEHEMIFLNADNIKLDEEFTYGVLAHEFQHMIHWNQDHNEDTWLNEGFSELASFISGYGAGGFEYAYVSNPDMQLTYWPGGDEDTSPYYGAAFLFTNYFLGRFSEKATQSLVGHPANGMVSVDEVLREIDAKNPDSGDVLTADDVFLDWTIATYLNNPKIADGRYAYQEYKDVPQTSETETIDYCPTEMETRDVHQFGVDLIKLTCRGNYQLNFEGSQQVKVLPMDAPSGYYAFWSNRGDDSNMTLTHKFDFREVDGDISMLFSMWYDLEENYDYLYLLASTNGEKWDIIKTPSGTDDDPSGNSYGWGYNNVSGDGPKWVEEKIDLSRYAGEEVSIRFEYVTDAAVNGEGFLLDNVSIPTIKYTTDFEKDDGGWVGAGFVRLQNTLPQKFRLALITEDNTPFVQVLSLNSDNTLSLPLELDKDAVLVVTGTTRFTNQLAAYRFEIQEDN